MAIEIVDCPINSIGGSFHSYVTVYQRVCLLATRSFPTRVPSWHSFCSWAMWTMIHQWMFFFVHGFPKKNVETHVMLAWPLDGTTDGSLTKMGIPKGTFGGRTHFKSILNPDVPRGNRLRMVTMDSGSRYVATCYITYPLVNVHITMERSTIFNG